MIKAYIMTSMSIGTYNKALEEIRKIKNVDKISVVTGDFDIVVKVHVKNLEDLHELTHQIHLIEGVEKTITSVITKEIILSDIETNILPSSTYHHDLDFKTKRHKQSIS